MRKLVSTLLLLVAAASLNGAAMAGTFDHCPDPDAARKWVKACMQENPYNTRESCEERALRKFCQ